MLFRFSARMLVSASLAVAVSGGPTATALAQTACSTPKSNLFLNPYNRQSAHHRPIGTGASYASNTHPATRDWLKAGHLNVNAGTPWGTDMLEAGPSDPIRVVGAQAHCDNVVGLPLAVRLPGHQSNVAVNHSPRASLKRPSGTGMIDAAIIRGRPP